MGSLPEFWPDIEGFQWDDGNASKNWTRHQVSQTEAEQVFLNRPLVVVGAPFRSEPRQFAFGHTDAGRLLTVVFTVRDSRLRVISVRPMSRRERRGYGQASDN
ncbi:MAG: BrnT family toxin [Candidatus Rokubacteria bacterium]|nr:BrnT family toxin [Candidatus Rokubacteria bacterium]